MKKPTDPITILLGVMVWPQFPLAGTWAIGVLLGIKLVFVGLIIIANGSPARSPATTEERTHLSDERGSRGIRLQ